LRLPDYFWGGTAVLVYTHFGLRGVGVTLLVAFTVSVVVHSVLKGRP
jgi:hypothetical protein